jgi:putative Holliday junction resolvase
MTKGVTMAEVVLALDVGERRIGVARGEVGSPFAFGRGVIERRNLQADLAAVKALAEAEGAARVVVGLPSRLRGGDSAQTSRVRAFAAQLRAAGLAVAFEDERFTSRIATQNLAQSGLKRGKRREKGRVDEGAAVLILETYLAKARAPRSTTPRPDPSGDAPDHDPS